MNLQETYAIEDCIKYHSTSITSTTTTNWTLPSTYKLEFNIKKASSGNNGGYIVIGASSSSNRVLIGQMGQNFNGVWVYTNNSWASQNNADHQPTAGSETIYTFSFDGSNYTFTNGVGDTLSGSISNVTMTNLAQIYLNNTLLKNIKIKPL